MVFVIANWDDQHAKLLRYKGISVYNLAKEKALVNTMTAYYERNKLIQS